MSVNTTNAIKSFSPSKIYILSQYITIFMVFKISSYNPTKSLPGLVLTNNDATNKIELYPFNEMSLKDEYGNIRKYQTTDTILDDNVNLYTFNITNFSLKLRKNGENIPLTLTENTISQVTNWQLNFMNVNFLGGDNICYFNTLAIYQSDVSSSLESIEQQLMTRWKI